MGWVSTTPVAVVPLKTYRWRRRQPCMTVEESAVHIRLPQYFGHNAWIVPITEVAAVDLANRPVVDNAVAFPDGLRIPYLPTTGADTTPTMLLAFRHRRRLPPVRWLAAGGGSPFALRHCRATSVATIDGVRLRVPDSARAVATLAAAGVHTTLDVTEWLARDRVMTREPAALAEVDAIAARDRLARRIGSCLFVAATAALAVASKDPTVVLPA